MQHVVYELELDDMVAFAEHYATNASDYQRQIRSVRWKVGLMLLALAILGGMALEDPVFTVIFGVLAAWYLIAYPRWAKRCVVNQSRDLFHAINPAHFGRHELVLDNHHLWSKSDANESTIKVSTLDRVEETSDYVFIYEWPHSAIIVPKQRMISGDAGALAAALGQAIRLKSF